jgi:hypothetical protein
MEAFGRDYLTKTIKNAKILQDWIHRRFETSAFAAAEDRMSDFWGMAPNICSVWKI